jgi:hypothetical protein
MMKCSVGDVKRIIRESFVPWIVRGGSSLLVKDVNDTEGWRIEITPKVLYFNEEEIVERPKKSRKGAKKKSWVFRKDDKLYLVDDFQFFSRGDA